jgi:hypothetical protein
LVEQTRQHIRQLVAEINQLAGSDIPPQQFYGEFLQRVVAAVAAVGGAVWSRDGQSPPRLQHQVNFLMSGLLNEAAGGGHTALVLHAFSNGSARLVPPRSGPGMAGLEGGATAERDIGSNSSDWSLLLAPMRVDKHTIGVVELLLDPTRRQTALENAVRFVSELCEIGAGYLKNRHLRQMLGQQHLWAQLENFVRQVHTSLHPKEVAFIVANEGKRMVECDRLSVALVYGRKPVIEAVSGQEVVERKSNLVQLMRRLCDTVLRSNENLLYSGEHIEGLPPAVRDALDDYLAESGSKVLAVTLLHSTTKEGTPEPTPFGALVGEYFEDATAAATIAPRMEVVGQHGAIALANAMAHHRVFMLPIWSAVGNSTRWLRGNRLAKLAVAVGGVAALIAAMVFVPWELRMEGRGQFVPENRRPVYAAEDGVVQAVRIDHGHVVEPGQPLVEMKSLELERRLKDLSLGRERAAAERDAALGSPRDSGATYRIADSAIHSYTTQIDLVQQQIRSLQVTAPVGGMIATWDPQRNLEGRPVKRGDALLTVSQIHGDAARWILEIRMPEHKIGHIREALSRRKAENNPDPLVAWFILASHPQRQFRGHVEQIATTAELDQENKEHIVMVRIIPDDVQRVDVQVAPLADQPEIRRVAQITMRLIDGAQIQVTPDAEVRAKVDCGKRAVGFVLLRELIEFFYETIVF